MRQYSKNETVLLVTDKAINFEYFNAIEFNGAFNLILLLNSSFQIIKLSAMTNLDILNRGCSSIDIIPNIYTKK